MRDWELTSEFWKFVWCTTSDRLWNFFEKINVLKIPFILGGDLNACSTTIGCTYNNRNGSTLENALTTFNYVLLNDYTPTRKDNILDLFICSPDFFSKADDLLVDDISGFDSDHHPVILNIHSDIILEQNIFNPT